MFVHPQDKMRETKEWILSDVHWMFSEFAFIVVSKKCVSVVKY